MGKLPALMAVALIALLCAASTALARGNEYKCNGTFTGVTINSDVEVPSGGACTLINSTVKGGVAVDESAYFQATGTSIWEDVAGDAAQTVFIDTGSTVGGDIVTDQTAQVFAFNSTINGSIGVFQATDTVDICGNAVKGEGIGVVRSGRDILVGDPLAVGCGGNIVTGDVLIAGNNTDVELVARGNTINKGSMYVLDNAGLSDKFVQSNTGAKTLRCTGNKAPFTGAPNPGLRHYQGQCSA
jgi:hypothetical protein